jgi:hypothetical protein
MLLLAKKRHHCLGNMTSFGLIFEGNESIRVAFDFIISCFISVLNQSCLLCIFFSIKKVVELIVII